MDFPFPKWEKHSLHVKASLPGSYITQWVFHSEYSLIVKLSISNQ